MTKADIQTRVSELQAIAAQASEVTVASLLAELSEAGRKATDASQFSAAVRAIEAKAKVSGLLTQRIEITDGSEELERAETPEEVAAVVAKHMAIDEGHKLTPEEHQHLASITLKWLDDCHEFLAAHKAKAVPNLDAIARENVERKRLGMRQRITNGSQPAR